MYIIKYITIQVVLKRIVFVARKNNRIGTNSFVCNNNNKTNLLFVTTSFGYKPSIGFRSKLFYTQFPIFWWFFRD